MLNLIETYFCFRYCIFPHNGSCIVNYLPRFKFRSLFIVASIIVSFITNIKNRFYTQVVRALILIVEFSVPGTFLAVSNVEEKQVG